MEQAMENCFATETIGFMKRQSKELPWWVIVELIRGSKKLVMQIRASMSIVGEGKQGISDCKKI